jgi:hypothetical protein
MHFESTGSLILQLLGAGALSLLVLTPRSRESLKTFFKLLVPRRDRWGSPGS